MNTNNMNRLFKTLGKYGKWQMIQVIIVAVGWIHASHSAICIVVLAYSPEHWCHEANTTASNMREMPSNSSYGEKNVSSSIKARGSCELVNTDTNSTFGCVYGYAYDIPADSSLVSEFDLVCNRDYVAQTSQTLYMIGQAISGYTSPIIADKFGRKRTYMWTFLLMLTTGIASSFAPDMTWFSVLRFINGYAQMGFSISGFVLSAEMFPLEVLHVIGMVHGMVWAVGICSVPLLGYLFQGISWRYLQLTMAAISVYFGFAIWYMDESVRWLSANGRDADAYKILKKAAQINKVDIEAVDQCLIDPTESFIAMLPKIPLQEVDCSVESPNAETCDEHEDEDSGTIPRGDSARAMCLVADKIEALSFVDIFRHPKLRRHFLISTIIWPVQSLTYYGILLMSNQLTGNRFLNLFLNGIVELCAKPLLLLALQWFGRRSVFIPAMLVCAAFTITAAVISALSEESIAVTVFLLGGKCLISSTYLLVWIYTPELYPTNLRSIGLGSATAAAYLFATVAPFAGYMSSYVRWGPGVVSGILCFISAMVALLLPETRGKPLAQTVAGIDALYTSRL